MRRGFAAVKGSAFTQVTLSTDREAGNQAAGILLAFGALRANALFPIGEGGDFFEPNLARIAKILVKRHRFQFNRSRSPRKPVLNPIGLLAKTGQFVFNLKHGDPVAQMDRAGAF
jgi:hypothetical protein